MAVLILFLVFTSLSFQSEEILQVQIVTRHGDRTPTSSKLFPKCQVDISKDLNLGHGQLTALGQHQCFLLGQSIHNRYISEQSSSKVKGISKDYHSGEYKFYSSSVSRTLQSAWSFSMGLFQGVGRKLDIYPYIFALPNGSTPIPYPTIQSQNDRLFFEYDNCAVLEIRVGEFFATKEGIDYVAKYLPLTTKLSEISGWEAPLPFISGPSDLAVILNDHKKLCEPIVPFIQDYIDLFTALNRVLYKRSIVGKLAGGGILTEIIDNFDGGVKMAHFSGHDSTILNVLYSLFVLDDYDDLYENPPFASALVLEKVNSNGTDYIRLLVQYGYDGELKSYGMKSLGCGDHEADLCEFSKFKELIKQKSVVSTSEWCDECLNYTDEKCLHYFLSSLSEKKNRSFRVV